MIAALRKIDLLGPKRKEIKKTLEKIAKRGNSWFVLSVKTGLLIV